MWTGYLNEESRVINDIIDWSNYKLQKFLSTIEQLYNNQEISKRSISILFFFLPLNLVDPFIYNFFLLDSISSFIRFILFPFRSWKKNRNIPDPTT